MDITARPEGESPRTRWRPALTILAILAAFGLGLVTARQRPTETTSPDPADLVAGISATGSRCSVQDGQRLQVGIEVANQGTATATILSLQATAPIEGLRLRGVGWGACGQLRPVPIDSTAVAGQPVRLIPPGGSDWLYALYDVSVDCPAPYHVRFLVDLGSPGLVDVGGFGDLGNVPYTGCT